MEEQFIRDRLSKLREEKQVSERKMSLDAVQTDAAVVIPVGVPFFLKQHGLIGKDKALHFMLIDQATGNPARLGKGDFFAHRLKGILHRRILHHTKSGRLAPFAPLGNFIDMGINVTAVYPAVGGLIKIRVGRTGR